MKFITACVVLCSIAVVGHSTSFDFQSNLAAVPVKESLAGKGFVAGIRATKDGSNFCEGALISALHVLTVASCITGNIRWVSLGSNASFGSASGEQIKVVAFMVHPNNTKSRKDFVVLELQQASQYKPVTLDEAQTIVTPGMIGGRIGWNDTLAEAVQSRYLHSVEVAFISNKRCAAEFPVDESNLCSNGLLPAKSCMGEKGAGIIVKNESHAVLVGLVSYTEGCGKPGGKNIYARVSAVRPWIDTIRQNTCVV